MRPEIRNIGIFAHVDAGKTTLSEQLLVHTGQVRRAGSVDSGTAHTDALPVERRRGISVKATAVSMTRKNVTINLIDTPGHMDFSAEVERSFWALDAAILIVDAKEGIQPQTELLFRALKEQGLPFLFFLNKTDREAADADRVITQIRARLTKDIIPLWDEEQKTEAICALDDSLMERWLEGEALSENELNTALIRLTQSGLAHPALKGSALRDQGIEALLDAVITCLPGPDEGTDALCGIVFSSAEDKTLGRGVWVRLFSGCLENRNSVELPGDPDPATGLPNTVQKKITQIRDPAGNDTGALHAGETGVIYGIGDARIGHVFGDPALLPRKVQPGSFRAPLITVLVRTPNREDMPALRQACMTLSKEDPLLNAQYVHRTEELHLQVMGRIQLEILEELLRTRFGLTVTFSEPKVIYKETLKNKTTGFVAYTMPKPCWAIMEFMMEPGPRGSGVTFESLVEERDIKLRYQHQVEQALPLALKQGRLGWQVTDIRIRLISGNDHIWHTHPLDFIVATPMGIHDGLQRGGTVLLEPILDARFMVPNECIGRVMSDVNQMRGEVKSTESAGDYSLVTADLPVSTSMDYSTTLTAFTGGRGSMTTRLSCYRECPPGIGETTPLRGTDPLDTAKYILAARNALDGGIFDF